MRNNLLVFLTFLVNCTNVVDKPISVIDIPSSEEMAVSNSIESTQNSCVAFNQLNTMIRDGVIEKNEALKSVKELLPMIQIYYYNNGGNDHDKLSWIFPVEGYGPSAIGGINGNGFQANRYDYFDGNKHIGHPAHDIFIYDNDQNNRDDRSSEFVNVISISEGIVVATSEVWDSTSTLRGGKYIWIYTPNDSSLFYYAHNNQIFVKPCDIVQPGYKIGYVGRTGLNAFKKRSPTHLHFMQLKHDKNYYPRPVNSYELLISINANIK